MEEYERFFRGIAQKYEVSVEHLRAWNNLKERQYIHPGDRLVVRDTSAVRQPEPATEHNTVSVAEGASTPDTRISFAVHPAVGDTIDRVERDRHGLFLGVRGFVSACYYRSPDGTVSLDLVTEGEGARVRLVSSIELEIVREKISSYER